MRYRPFLRIVCASSLYLCLCLAAAAQASHHATKPATTPGGSNAAERAAAVKALTRLKVLRDGWNDVNRQYIRPNFTAGRKIDSRFYEVQYLEAKTAVDEALSVLPRGELRAAIEQAMALFDDLEQITSIFAKKSPLTTSVRVADIYSYLKEYNIPYEEGVSRASSGLVLHQDFVLSYILPLRYRHLNRIEVLLGGKAEPVPPPPTLERMFGVPKRIETPAPASIKIEELKEVASQAIAARLHGDRQSMGAILDSGFVYSGREGRRWDKEQYLSNMSSDPTVKGFTIERAELGFRSEAPTLTTIIRYESLRGEVKSYVNTFTFARRDGKWLIAGWRPF